MRTSVLGLILIGTMAGQAEAGFQTRVPASGAAHELALQLASHHSLTTQATSSMMSSPSAIHQAQLSMMHTSSISAAPPVHITIPAAWQMAGWGHGFKTSLTGSQINQINSALISEIGRMQAGLAPQSTGLVDPWLARRALNPTRFDHFHPVFGGLLNEDMQLRAALCSTFPNLNGILPDSPFFNYLRWRRSLDPTRFDHFHPNIGPLIGLDQQLRNNCPCMCNNPTPQTPSGPEIVLPPASGSTNNGGPTPSGTPPTPPGPPTPPPPLAGEVPEPSSLALLAVGTLLAASQICRRRRGRALAA